MSLGAAMSVVAARWRAGFHPAALLLAWLAFAVALQFLSLPFLAGVLAASACWAAWAAADNALVMLHRARWLLVSITLLYLFATPGVYLPGLAGKVGMTHEGVSLGKEQLTRLAAMLLGLALVFRMLGTQGMLNGLYWLLRPFSWGKMTVVRLTLTLEFAKRPSALGWRDSLLSLAEPDDTPEERLAVVHRRFRCRDYLLVGASYSPVLWLAMRP